MRVVLVEPEIPQNTGSIARLTAGAKLPLHLVKPLGFSLEDRYLKRAGLDYWPAVDLHLHDNFAAFTEEFPLDKHRCWMLTTKTQRPYTSVRYEPDDILIFGRETKGLGPAILGAYPDRLLTIPIWGKIRSYNLSNAVSIVLFEALRQTRPADFGG